jgi:hypothetical protein
MQEPAAQAAAPAAPATASPEVSTADASDLYDAARAHAKELHRQLDNLLSERSDAVRQANAVGQSTLTGPSRLGMEERISRLDKRIAGLEEQIAQADHQVAAAAAVPGAVQEVPMNTSDDEENFFAGAFTATAIILVFLFIRRRFWRRKPKTGPALAIPSDLAQRIERIENVAESTAIEVERIGEGQRFVTKLLSEQKSPVRIEQ